MKKKKYAVVTGGTSGIGKAIAEKFLEEGYTVLAVFANNQEAAEKMNEQYANTGRFSVVQQDLCDYNSAVKLADKITNSFPRVDVLVLNSATTDLTPFGNIAPERWMRVMDVNLNGPFFLVQQLAPMITEQRGRIIFIGSLMGQYPHARSISYGVSKAAVQALTKNLVKFFSPKGVTVNCIVPSFVETPWQAAKTPEHRKRIECKIALHRFCKPIEIAELCMCIVKNQYINGSVLNIDGGYCFE